MTGWPQVAILFLVGLSLVVHIIKDGEPRQWSGIGAFFDGALLLWLLWMGGFFK